MGEFVYNDGTQHGMAWEGICSPCGLLNFTQGKS